MKYDIVVVGAGHAGCEAAMASARLGMKTALITINYNNIADMPCNPSIGGSAKGIVVREIAALGGVMGEVADQAILQLKMLNTKKGPGVRSLRAQIDKEVYKQVMLSALENQPNLDIIEDLVIALNTTDNKITGLTCETKGEIKADAVILTTGTYLNSRVLVGSEIKIEGPHGERTDNQLSTSLKALGFNLQRLKTGTPPRIEKQSIDLNKVKLEPGDEQLYTFSFNVEPNYLVPEQVPCYLTYTTDQTKQIIEDNINKSSMYGGINEKLGIGPRYCPSIEDKITRFNDKERHQLFLEPESLAYDDIYIQGFSSSMPYDIQHQMVNSIIGLENAIIKKYAYAIEYDALDPLVLKPSLETKLVENLFTAGQINGTSGYEEAAGQGLIAGVNATLKLKNKAPLILGRDEAYIGVLIDDLVTKGTREPYRLLTSRAEYRLLLRSDNADLRLSSYGHQIGLISDDSHLKLNNKIKAITELKADLQTFYITPTKDINDWLTRVNSTEIKDRMTLYHLLKRPEITIEIIIENFFESTYDPFVLEQVSIDTKYEGYFEKLHKEINKVEKSKHINLEFINDYKNIPNLASEAVQKLNEVKPINLAQASRISGVNPSDVAIIMVYLKREGRDGL